MSPCTQVCNLTRIPRTQLACTTEDVACNYAVLLLYLERLTHPRFPPSYYVLVNEADEDLGLKKRRYSTREKSQFCDEEQHMEWEELLRRSLCFRRAAGTSVTSKRESQQCSAGKHFWQKEEFAKQENKKSKNFSHCRAMPLHPGQESRSSA